MTVPADMPAMLFLMIIIIILMLWMMIFAKQTKGVVGVSDGYRFVGQRQS